MEKEEILSLLDTINVQESSSILGGREKDYQDLEMLGYITINTDKVQHSASLTPKGREYLEQENYL